MTFRRQRKGSSVRIVAGKKRSPAKPWARALPACDTASAAASASGARASECERKHGDFPKSVEQGSERAAPGSIPRPCNAYRSGDDGLMRLRVGRGLKRCRRGAPGRQRCRSAREKGCGRYRTRPPNRRRRSGQAGWHCRARSSRMQNRDGGLWAAERATRARPWRSRSSRQDKAHARRAGRPGHRCRFGKPAAARNVVPARRVAGKARRRKEPTRNDSGCLFAAFPCQPVLVPSNRPRSFGGTNEGPLSRRLLRRNRRPLQEAQGRSVALRCSPTRELQRAQKSKEPTVQSRILSTSSWVSRSFVRS